MYLFFYPFLHFLLKSFHEMALKEENKCKTECCFAHKHYSTISMSATSDFFQCYLSGNYCFVELTARHRGIQQEEDQMTQVWAQLAGISFWKGTSFFICPSRILFTYLDGWQIAHCALNCPYMRAHTMSTVMLGNAYAAILDLWYCQCFL